jgi:hypothetical protein
MKKLFTIICLFALPYISQAQHEQLHQVSKRLEKTFAYQPGYEVNIEGEKADVVIETWDRAEIGITLEMNARHPEKAVAEADVEKIRYLAKRIKNKIYIRNYISLQEGEKEPESNLHTKYTIKVPEECPVYLKNYFGVADVSNLSNRFRFFGEFTKIGMKNISGHIDLRSRFGDINGNTLDGQVSIASRRSDVSLENISGSYDIDAQYGLVAIYSIGELLNLDIKAEQGDVFLFDPRIREYGFNLQAQNGKVHVPESLEMELLSNSTDIKKLNFKPRQEFYPNITISVTFGDLHIQKEKHAKSVKP